MAEYLPLFTPGKAVTRQASATITAGQLVIVTGSGTVGPGTAATHLWVGVAGNDALNGDDVLVFCEGVQRISNTGGVTAGQLVEAATAGTIATHTNGTNDFNVVGLALTTATAGNLVEVSLLR